MAATAKITEKTTKKDMLAYIKTIQKQLEEEKKNRGVDKKAALKVIEQKKVVASASQTSVEDIIKTFRVNINESLSGFEEQLLAKKAKLDEVQKAITIEENRLQEVYDIETQADTLQVLLRAHEQEEESFEAAKDKARLEWRQEQEDHDKWVREREAQTKKEWERKLEEHRYDWKIKQSREIDEFNEQKRLKERQLKEIEETTIKALQVREDAISAKEEEFENLKVQVAAIEENQSKAVLEAVEKALQSEKKSRAFEVSALKKDHESTLKVLTNSVETAQSMIENLTAQNEDLKTKLETAHQEIRNIAKDAIHGAAQAKVFVTQDTKPSSK